MAASPRSDPPVRVVPTLLGPPTGRPQPDPVACERCGGANVYRMHAVWRCADCGFKTDCCGW